MVLPTMDQTEGIWIIRSGEQGYHFIQEIFPKATEIDSAHRVNCRRLIRQGRLQPEHGDRLPPSDRDWNEAERYCRVALGMSGISAQRPPSNVG